MKVPHDQAKSIFLGAVEIASAQERRAFIDARCIGDDALRAEVEEFLAHHQGLGSFLQAAPAGLTSAFGAQVARGTAEDSGPAEGPGAVVGPYKLLEQIGEGGMGLVFMAEQQQPVRRKVAVKVLKPGMDSRQVIARFEAERQALALMDHPNIARVLDAGETASGRPHFVMELVRGVSITDYCDENRLTTRERLELFTHVCQAVQHAHHKGVIHRDIKPSNVMVTLHNEVAVVKVIDFGIAKALGQQLTDKTLYTGFAQLIGTPLYMSPEQAQLSGLDVDTRSDVYSLGVLLYELLTGTTPFDPERLRAAGYDEMRRIIREEESPRPSMRLSTLGLAAATVSERRRSDPRRLSQLLRGELDWILMKALEKDRSRRYESASAFAADVERYLRDEPVAACPPAAWYRFRKFARRNRGVLTTGAVVVAALLLATVVSTWQAIRATNATAAEREVRLGLDEALIAENAALGQATTSARVADENRRAAEESRKAMQITLADMNTTQGLIAAERDKPAQAVLWFANAARLAHSDPERERSNRVRVRTWGRKTFTPVAALSTAAPVRTLAFHPRSDCLLALGMDGECILHDVRKDEAIGLPGGRRKVGAAVWSPDGALLAVGGGEGQLEVFAFPSMKLLHQITHRGPIRALAFNPAGDCLAAASGVVRVWNVRTQAFLAGALAHPQPVETLLFNPEGNRLATGCRDNRARVFAVSGEEVGPEPLFVPLPHVWCPDEHDLRYGTPAGPAFIDGGRGLLTRENRAAAAWSDAETGKLVRRLPAPAGLNAQYTMAADPAGRRAVLCGTAAQVWDTVTGRPAPARPLAMRHDVASASFSGDGRLLLTGSLDNTFKLWSLPEGRLLAEQDLHEAVLSTALSPDGRLLAAGMGWGRSFIRVWCAPEGNPSHPAPPVWSAAYSPFGSLVRLSRDGRHLVSSGWYGKSHFSGAKTRVYEVATGKPAGVPLRAPGPIVVAEFSPDQRRVALLSIRPDSEAGSSGVTGEVSCWDWQTGKRIFERAVLPAAPNDLRYSPDGTSLAAIGNRGQIILLDADTGKVRRTFQSDVVEANMPPGNRGGTQCRIRKEVCLGLCQKKPFPYKMGADQGNPLQENGLCPAKPRRQNNGESPKPSSAA